VAVAALAVDARRPATVYAGTSRGVFKTTNGGRRWRAASAGLGRRPVQSLAVDPGRSATVYAGTQEGGVYRSTNGGESWRRLRGGLPPVAIPALAVDPRNGAVYAGTYGAGVFDWRS
jgi:photosystem II stability/assembly factor-like uncharacterized protein